MVDKKVRAVQIAMILPAPSPGQSLQPLHQCIGQNFQLMNLHVIPLFPSVQVIYCAPLLGSSLEGGGEEDARRQNEYSNTLIRGSGRRLGLSCMQWLLAWVTLIRADLGPQGCRTKPHGSSVMLLC